MILLYFVFLFSLFSFLSDRLFSAFVFYYFVLISLTFLIFLASVSFRFCFLIFSCSLLHIPFLLTLRLILHWFLDFPVLYKLLSSFVCALFLPCFTYFSYSFPHFPPPSFPSSPFFPSLPPPYIPPPPASLTLLFSPAHTFRFKFLSRSCAPEIHNEVKAIN